MEHGLFKYFSDKTNRLLGIHASLYAVLVDGTKRLRRIYSKSDSLTFITFKDFHISIFVYIGGNMIAFLAFIYELVYNRF